MKIGQDVPHRRARTPIRARLADPPVLVALLVLTFVLGWLLARLPLIGGASGVPTPLPSPRAPTPLPPSPTPAATPAVASLVGSDVLQTLYLDIPPDSMAELAAKRQEALERGILLTGGGDYVPATIRVGQEQIAVELRLKGDWIDHIAHDKWSFRVRTVEDQSVFGMHTFSLQDPSTRSFLNEWLFLENLRMEDVLAVRYHFVHVVQNGEYMGIYAMEEGFARELFETQGRREGVIIRYDEDLLWEYRALYDDQVTAPGVDRFYLVDDFQSGRVAADPVLAAQRDVAIGLLRAVWTGERTGGEVFDVEAMGTFLALTDLWHAEHALIWHNLRYHYDPITSRLEPVVFDAQPLPDYLDPEVVGLEPVAFYGDPQLEAAYVRALARLLRPGYVDELQAHLGPQFEHLRAALSTEFNPRLLEPPWDVLRRRQHLLLQRIDPHQTTYAYVHRPQPAPTTTLDLDVGNLLDLPLELVSLTWEDGQAEAHSGWVTPESAGRVVQGTGDALVLRSLPRDATHMPYVHLQIPHPELAISSTLDLPRLTLVTRLWGLTRTHTQTVVAGYPPALGEGPRPDPPTLAQALARHPYLEPVEGATATLRIPSGTWNVAGDLVLPAGFGLNLGPSTTLRFEPDALLLATGPLSFTGRAEAPIRLEPQEETWDGIVVLQAGAPSTWEHVTVERASAVERGGWSLTGGITFYESPIRLDRCRILDSRGEDGINVVRTEFLFTRSEFGPSASDGFDGDFARGTVEECSFHDIAGDGIDVSGSEVLVQQVVLRSIGDKGISVGEASRLTAREIDLQDVTFGVVSKDLSHVELANVRIAGVQLAALAAYVKKPAFGPASMVAEGVTFVDVPVDRRTLVQVGSWIELEGERVWGVEVDVEALYGAP